MRKMTPDLLPHILSHNVTKWSLENFLKLVVQNNNNKNMELNSYLRLAVRGAGRSEEKVI